ncbi:MAG: pentapeptide repeat-containing protein [Variovorax paradoxus]|uniref:Pentapeptide repeat-containing protein n=1 Tax=Variovorax paradoxus TaxID=34073 RepID=A0A2W5SEE0_VARPD|nr:MAG: pentapeptide repeat-containing protein [Variovorax paradoxus]
MKQQILNRWTNEVLFECDVPDDVESGLAVRYALEKATEAHANLSGAYLRDANLSGAYLSDAYLSGANLSGAYLRDANLSGAYLRDANLSGAYLRDANLIGAYLRDANLSGAYLSGANLSGANLSDAYLRDANLSGAYLSGANLSGANLSDAYLSDAYLSGANLSGANLSGAIGADYAIACTRILPEGSLIGWKKCKDGLIVKLRIPEEAKRSHAFGRKCRAEFADVLAIEQRDGDGWKPAELAIAKHDGKTEYRVGQRVVPDSFSEDWMEECAPGIHFFLTRLEAEAY